MVYLFQFLGEHLSAIKVFTWLRSCVLLLPVAGLEFKHGSGDWRFMRFGTR